MGVFGDEDVGNLWLKSLQMWRTELMVSKAVDRKEKL